MDEFEEAFPIPAHWIEWSSSKNRYDCHVGLADSKCSEYNNMFKVWQHQQAKIDELQKRVDAALQMLSDWDNQTYRDDAEQLLGELGDVLRGERG